MTLYEIERSLRHCSQDITTQVADLDNGERDFLDEYTLRDIAKELREMARGLDSVADSTSRERLSA